MCKILQVAEEVFLLSRTVRTFGTEQPEKERYQRRLGILRHISIRQAAAYLLYLTSNSFLFNLTKVTFFGTATAASLELHSLLLIKSLCHRRKGSYWIFLFWLYCFFLSKMNVS